MINNLIKTVYENGNDQLLYDIFFVLGFVSVFCVVTLFGRKIGIAFWKSAIVVLIVYPLAVLWMFILYWIDSGFTAFGGNNIVRVFVYVPLIGLIPSKLLKLKWKDVCSLLAVGPIAVHGISHFGCIFAGCCQGYPYEAPLAIYNAFRQKYLFPIQPIEAIAAILIIVYIILRTKKLGYVTDGKEYPIMLVLFGSTRFFFEFFRDNGKLFFGCSSLSFHALFMFVVGVVVLGIMNKKEKAKLNISDT